jgi:hypothetical protein
MAVTAYGDTGSDPESTNNIRGGGSGVTVTIEKK